MSLDHILNKLAEKEMLKGNSEYAFKLITSADQTCSKCDAKSPKLVKKKGGMLCPDCVKPMKKTALEKMLEKYASKKKANHMDSEFEHDPSVCPHDYIEDTHSGGWGEPTTGICEQCGTEMEGKYVIDGEGFDVEWLGPTHINHHQLRERAEREWLKSRGSFSSSLKSMLKKYAQNSWEQALAPEEPQNGADGHWGPEVCPHDDIKVEDYEWPKKPYDEILLIGVCQDCGQKMEGEGWVTGEEQDEDGNADYDWEVDQHSWRPIAQPDMGQQIKNAGIKVSEEDTKEPKKTSQEAEIERHNRERDKWDRRKQRWDKFKSENPNYKKSSTLKSMLSKYAQMDDFMEGSKVKHSNGRDGTVGARDEMNPDNVMVDWGNGMPQSHAKHELTQSDIDFTEDDFNNHLTQGWDAGQTEQDKNPYPLDSPQGLAWRQGFDEALSGKAQDYPDTELGY